LLPLWSIYSIWLLLHRSCSQQQYPPEPCRRCFSSHSCCIWHYLHLRTSVLYYLQDNWIINWLHSWCYESQAYFHDWTERYWTLWIRASS
jgi:hypothetical protein